MLRYTVILCYIFSTSICSSQVDQKESLTGLFGYGLHGSGDLNGYQYSLQYSKTFKGRWSWVLDLGGSLHDAKDDILIYQNDQGNDVDATLHHVIGGVQVGFGIKYHFVKTSNHNFNAEIIPLVRYQATSISDLIVTIFPSTPDLPFPVRNLVRFAPARTVAVGSSFRLKYHYSFVNNYTLGVGAAYQTDTNGDSILSSFLSFGKAF